MSRTAANWMGSADARAAVLQHPDLPAAAPATRRSAVGVITEAARAQRGIARQDAPPIGAMDCAVCGSLEVIADTVHEGGWWLLLAECPRCDHRWTRPLRDVPAPERRRMRVAAMRAEVADAA